MSEAPTFLMGKSKPSPGVPREERCEVPGRYFSLGEIDGVASAFEKFSNTSQLTVKNVVRMQCTWYIIYGAST